MAGEKRKAREIFSHPSKRRETASSPAINPPPTFLTLPAELRQSILLSSFELTERVNFRSYVITNMAHLNTWVSKLGKVHEAIQADVSYMEYQSKQRILRSWLDYALDCKREGVEMGSVMYCGGFRDSEIVVGIVEGLLEEMEEEE